MSYIVICGGERMDLILKNATCYTDGTFSKRDIAVIDGNVEFDIDKAGENSVFVDFSDCIIVPGLTDVHVHLREPGFSYKETIKTGTKASARGGYTNVFSMPNLNPVPDNADNLKMQTDIIEKDACINVYPYGAITVGQKGEALADLEGMSDKVKGFSDDGRGVQNPELMKKAMEFSKENDKIIVAHCEDNSLLNGGYIHDGEYAKTHNHKGICSESEYGPIIRDIKLAKETGCKYHVCHVSAKESVEAIRQAKKDGVDITCETGPHYLVFSDMDLKEEGRFKMNPPIRSKEDRQALIDGIIDGTVDMIATDHAPHSAEEKSKGLKDSLMGVVGIETAFSVMYTHFVKTGILSLEKLIEIMSVNPSKRFGIENEIKSGEKASFAVFDLASEYTINTDDFLSKGKATPFENMKVYGKTLMTMCNGNVVYDNFSERIIRNA